MLLVVPPGSGPIGAPRPDQALQYLVLGPVAAKLHHRQSR